MDRVRKPNISENVKACFRIWTETANISAFRRVYLNPSPEKITACRCRVQSPIFGLTLSRRSSCDWLVLIA
jgi:hypothetical protein